MRYLRLFIIAALTIATLGLVASTADAAVRITRSELNGGQLRVEGTGALPTHTITITPGPVTGTSDSSGSFRIEKSSYSSPTCQVTVSDGATSVTASLSGCTPSTTTTTSPPAPTSTTTTPPPAPASAVTFSPSSLTFPAQNVGTTSASQTVTATNTSGASFLVNSAAVHSLDFTVVDDQCSGLTIANGASCAVSITFSPTTTGTRTATYVFTHNNVDSNVPLTGSGAGNTPPLAIDTRFMTCTNGVCDIGAGSNVFVNNFFSTGFLASGGHSPYTWSGTVPAGLALRPSGLVLGSPSTLGTSTFNVTVTDADGSTATGTFSLTVASPPGPTPAGCQTGGVRSEALSGPAFNGRTPSGSAKADMTKFSGCGGFSTLTVSVSNVNVPDGTQLWVTLDFGAVGTITVRGRSGTMALYNMGRFGVSHDEVRVYSALPDVDSSVQILIGGGFV
jgi:hypothetical protein